MAAPASSVAVANIRLRRLSSEVLGHSLGLDAALADAFADMSEPAGRLDLIDQQAEPRQQLRLLVWHLEPVDCVWWAYLCLSLVCKAEQRSLPPIFGAVDAWLRRHDDAARFHAYADASVIGFDKPEAMLGLAAFLSGTTTAPPNLPAAAPDPNGACQAALAAVELGAGFDAARPLLDRATALALAGAIARGDNGQAVWEAAAARLAGAA
jgi:hypothetical protein